MHELRILGLLITDRIKEAGMTQEVLSQYAHIIRSRLGFHEVTEDVCSRVGFVLLQVSGTATECDSFEQKLAEIRGIEIQKMVFKY
jgi:hypothetical protein